MEIRKPEIWETNIRFLILVSIRETRRVEDLYFRYQIYLVFLLRTGSCKPRLRTPGTANFLGAYSPRSVCIPGACLPGACSPRNVCLLGACVSQERVNFSDLTGSELRSYEMPGPKIGTLAWQSWRLSGPKLVPLTNSLIRLNE